MGEEDSASNWNNNTSRVTISKYQTTYNSTKNFWMSTSILQMYFINKTPANASRWPIRKKRVIQLYSVVWEIASRPDKRESTRTKRFSIPISRSYIWLIRGEEHLWDNTVFIICIYVSRLRHSAIGYSTFNCFDRKRRNFFCRARQIGAVATVADSACSFSELHRPSKSRPIGIVSWRVFDVELVEWGILEFILSSACWHIVRIFYEWHRHNFLLCRNGKRLIWKRFEIPTIRTGFGVIR